MKKIKLRKIFNETRNSLQRSKYKDFVKELRQENQTFCVYELPRKTIIDVQSDFSAN